jgi:D-amino-acid dehydrogenase
MGRPYAVIGGGFVGLCSALHLQRIGQQVVVIDPGDPKRAASYGNSGQFAVGEVVPLSVPGVLFSVPKWLLDPLGPLAIRWRDLPALTPWLIRFLREATPARLAEISGVMARLCDLIHLDYEPLISAAQAEDLVIGTDCYRLYETRAEWQGERTWQLRERAGLQFQLLESVELHTREPAIGERYGFAAVIKGRTYVRSPLQLMEALGALVMRQGGSMIAAEAKKLFSEDRRVKAVILSDGQHLDVEGVVVAAGAWSGRLCAQLGDRVPLQSERGYHVMLPNPGVKLGRSVTIPSRGYGIVPMAEGLRLAGTVELARVDAPPNYARADRLLENARAALPGINVEGAERWMGHRPSLPDSLPIIDRASGYENAIYAFGHGHMGLSWAATTGRLVASLVSRQPTNFDMTPLRLNRF